MRTTIFILLIVLPFVTHAQINTDKTNAEQDAQTKALDATATQWSFQLAFQFMPDYYDDMVNDTPRRPGLDNYLQFRVVAPIPLKSFTILPRLTMRHYEDINTGKSGLGNTELFALIVPKATDWGTGRAGIGPMVTFPGNKNVAKDEWGYGLSAAIVNASGQWFYGVLFTQSWRAVDPRALQPDVSSSSNPLGIAPFLAYRFGKSGFYIQTADLVALYDWNTKGFYLPLGARFGKVLVMKKGSLNVYAEYATSAIYKEWQGPAVKNSYRINFTYTVPVGVGK
jgi:hypothetical protein